MFRAHLRQVGHGLHSVHAAGALGCVSLDLGVVLSILNARTSAMTGALSDQPGGGIVAQICGRSTLMYTVEEGNEELGGGRGEGSRKL